MANTNLFQPRKACDVIFVFCGFKVRCRSFGFLFCSLITVNQLQFITFRIPQSHHLMLLEAMINDILG